MWNGEEVIINGQPIRRGIRKGQYFVKSNSDQTKIYEIDIINSTHPDCMGFFHRHTCIHWQLCKQDYENNAKLSEVLLTQMQTMSGKSMALWIDMFKDEDIEDAITQGYIIIHNGVVLWI